MLTGGLDWWFEVLGVPISKIPFQKRIPGIQTTNPNHQVTISWRDLVYHISTPELPSFMRPIDRATTGAWQLSAHWISKKTKKTREPGLYLMDQESCDMRPTSSDNHANMSCSFPRMECVLHVKCIDMPWNAYCHWRVFCGTHQLHPSDIDTPARPSSRWWCRAGPFAAFLFSGNLWMLWYEKWATSHFFR